MANAKLTDLKQEQFQVEAEKERKERKRKHFLYRP